MKETFWRWLVFSASLNLECYKCNSRQHRWPEWSALTNTVSASKTPVLRKTCPLNAVTDQSQSSIPKRCFDSIVINPICVCGLCGLVQPTCPTGLRIELRGGDWILNWTLTKYRTVPLTTEVKYWSILTPVSIWLFFYAIFIHYYCTFF